MGWVHPKTAKTISFTTGALVGACSFKPIGSISFIVNWPRKKASKMGVIHEKINYALEHSLEEPIMTLNSTLWPHHSMFLNFIHVECFVHIELIQFIIHIYVPIDIVQFHPYYQVQHVFMFHPKNVQIVQLNPTCFHVSSKECSNSPTQSNMFSCFIQRMFK